MRKIAIFTETFLPKVDGIVTRLKYTAEHLVKLGDEVMIFSPDGGLTEYCGAKIYGVSGFPLPLYPELKLALPRPSIGYALEQFQPDLIHVVNPAVLGLAGLFYAKSMKLPLLASYHTHLPQYLHHYGLGFLEGTMWELLRTAHNQADLNLATSTAMISDLRLHGIERLELWQRAVDTDRFHPRWADPDIRSKLSQGHSDATLLLYVGRLSAEKEIHKLLPVLAAIPNSRLALVGDGPFRQELERMFAGTPTHFVGYLQGQELAAAFASSDVFVFPSRTETLGLVVLESMAAGCPVVAANAGGVPDIITDGVNGYLFDPDLPDSLLACTQKMLANLPFFRQCVRQEAERWSWSSATQNLQKYYDHAIESSHASLIAR